MNFRKLLLPLFFVLTASCTSGCDNSIGAPSGTFTISADKEEVVLDLGSTIAFRWDSSNIRNTNSNAVKFTSTNPDFSSSDVTWNGSYYDSAKWTYYFRKAGTYDITANINDIVSNTITVEVYQSPTLKFNQESYEYEYNTEFKVDYAWEHYPGSKSTSDYHFVFSKNEANASVNWKKGSDGFYTAYIKSETIGECLMKVTFGSYSSHEVKFTFVDSADYTTSFYDTKGELIKSVVHKCDVEVDVPTIDDPHFKCWSNGSEMVQLGNKLIDRGNTSYYAISNNITGTNGLKYELNSEQNGYIVTGYSGIEFDVEIPLVYNNLYVTEIASEAFKNKAITSITISQGVKRIRTSAFYGSSIEYCKFLNGSVLNTIDGSAFKNCSSLEWTIIPSSIKYIDKYCFESCSNLVIMFQLDSLTGLNFSSYWNYSSRPTRFGVKYLVESDSSNLYSYVVMKDGSASIIKFLNNETTQINVDTVDGFTVTEIFPSSFVNNVVKEIKISRNITSIGSKAFYGCSNLEKIDFSEATELTSIGNSAFYNCTNIKSVNLINTKLTSIGSNSFYNCSSLEDILLPDSVTSIDKYCFENCSKLYILLEAEKTPSGFSSYWNYSNRPVYYNITKCVQLDSTGTYKYCVSSDGAYILALVDKTVIDVNLTTKVDNYSVAGICYRAFATTGIEKVTLPNTVKFIAPSAFYSCANLSEFNINKTSCLASIGDNAFYGCSNLIAINIPLSVTSIGKYAFENCSSLYILFEAMDTSDISLSSYWNYSSRPVSYLVTSLNYKYFNTNGSFYYYETSRGQLGFLKWIGYTSNCGPTTDIDITSIDGKPFVEICDKAFNGCKSYDGSGPFDWITYYKNINIKIGASVEKIGNSAFKGMYEESIYGGLYSSDTYFNIIFEKNSKIKTIGSYAFESARLNSDVILGKEITSIGAYAFGLSTWVSDSHVLWIEKGSSAGMSLGNYWNGKRTVHWGTEWHYNDSDQPILN